MSGGHCRNPNESLALLGDDGAKLYVTNDSVSERTNSWKNTNDVLNLALI